MTGSERRLHPLTLLFDIGGDLRQIAIPLVIVVFVSQSRSGGTQLVAPLIVLLITAVIAVARYLSYSYRYDASELVIRSGIFVRNERRIPYDRIQNIDAVQNVGHRLLGVVKVQVQTGAGTEPEATLSVLPVTALDEMRERVRERGGRVRSPAPAGTDGGARAASIPGSMRDSVPGSMRGAVPAPVGRTLLTLPLRELVLSGFIDNRGLVVILGALGVLTQLDPLPDLAADRLADWIPGVTRADFSFARLGDSRMIVLIGAAILALLLFVRIVSTAWAAVRLHDFRLTRTGDTLRMEYGSVTRVTATIPVHRIQTIAIHETLLHRRLARAAVRVTTAGGGTGTSGATEREWLAPIIRRADLPALLDELQPGLELGAIAWRAPHPKAFGRIARRSVAIALIIAAGAAIFVGQWAITIGAILIIRAIARARLHVRHLGWSALRDGVIFRGGWIRRTTTFARFSRVQAVQLEESPLDRRASMAHVSVDTAAAPLGITYLARGDAVELKELVARHAAGTAFTW